MNTEFEKELQHLSYEGIEYPLPDGLKQILVKAHNQHLEKQYAQGYIDGQKHEQESHPYFAKTFEEDRDQHLRTVLEEEKARLVEEIKLKLFELDTEDEVWLVSLSPEKAVEYLDSKLVEDPEFQQAVVDHYSETIERLSND